MNETKPYKDLTHFLLDEVQKRPAMYLGNNATISNLATFITGYEVGFLMCGLQVVKQDSYFGVNGFIDWFVEKKKLEPLTFWETPFVEEANYSQEDALWVYFKYLEEYRDYLEQT